MGKVSDEWFMQLSHKYEVERMELKAKISKSLLRELIDRIEVFETEGVGKNRTQRIVIYCCFVGYIELPWATPSSNYKEDTRKGVAVEYILKPLSA